MRTGDTVAQLRSHTVATLTDTQEKVAGAAADAFPTIADSERPPPPAQAAWCANPFVEWLLVDGSQVTDPAGLVKGLADRMVEAGIALTRMRATIRTLHPQVIGVNYTWFRATGEVQEYQAPHSIVQTDQFLMSPYAAIFQGAGGMRRRLDLPGEKLDYPILEDLRSEGMTDYCAMPLVFSDGTINAITFAADRPGGFTTRELERIYEMLPVLSRAFELFPMRRTARTLLDTYLGKYTGARVLDGLIKRGDGEDIHAVIWFCDLRESTKLAESMSREAFLGFLNDFFDCMAGAVLDQGGEVLRFIGDAALAIFPIIEESADTGRDACTRYEACRMALAAARDAMRRIEELNGERTERGEPPLRYGIGLHIGDVTYGNIGVPQRLEFTVIGAAANETARLENLCKTLDFPIIVSARFAGFFPGELMSLGRHDLRGVAVPQEVFTLPELRRPA